MGWDMLLVGNDYDGLADMTTWNTYDHTAETYYAVRGDGIWDSSVFGV